MVAAWGTDLQILSISSAIRRPLRGFNPSRRSARGSFPESLALQPITKTISEDRQHDGKR